MKGVSQTLKQRVVYVSSDCTAKKNQGDNTKLNSQVPLCRHTQEFTTCDLKISTGASICVVAAPIHEQCGSWPQELLLLYQCLLICAQYERCSASQPADRFCLIATTVSTTRNQSAGAVCKHLPLGSFLQLDTNFVYQLLKMDFVTDLHQQERDWVTFPVSFQFMCIVCTRAQEDAVEGLDSPGQVKI